MRVDPPSLGGKMSGQRYHIAVRGQFDQHLPVGNAELHRRLPLLLLTGLVLSGLPGKASAFPGPLAEGEHPVQLTGHADFWHPTGPPGSIAAP